MSRTNAKKSIVIAGREYLTPEQYGRSVTKPVSSKRVWQWVEEGRIDGVLRVPGTCVLIPADAPRPRDRRAENPGRPRKTPMDEAGNPQKPRKK